MPSSCTDIPAPAQGLADHAYDQSLTGRQKHRQRLAQRHRIAAYARLVMAVAERRRLADAEVRDLLVVQPDDAARVSLLHELAEAGAVRWETVGLTMATRPGLWEVAAAGARRQLDLPLAETDGRAAP